MVVNCSYLKNLMRLRKENNLTLQKLANAIGITNQSINRLETGENVPSFKNLLALADYFDVSIDYLVGRSDSPEVHKPTKREEPP